MAEKHLTDDALVILAGRQCPDEIKSTAASHLESCAECRARLQDTRRVYSAWTQILDRGLLARENRVPFRSTMIDDQSARFPWKPIVGLLTCCLAIGFLLFGSSVVPTVRANSILSRAIKAEPSIGIDPEYRFSVDKEPCGRTGEDSKRQKAKAPSACGKAITSLRSAHWSTDHPISASAYSRWRRGLSRKRDIVTSEPSLVKLETLTEVSPIRQATLMLRTADYRPISLDLEFADETEILFVEDTGPVAPELPSIETSKIEKMAAPAATPPRPNPLDEAEADAWQTLCRMGEDSGWETIVVRRGETVEVEGQLPDQQRAQELRSALQKVDRVSTYLDLSTADAQQVLATRSLGGDAPALAHDWLEQQFPDVEDRSRYVNGVLDHSKAILGHAFFLDRLGTARRGMTSSKPAHKVDELIAARERGLDREEASLASTLRPLLGEPHQNTRPLTYREAVELDGALGALLAASNGNEPSYKSYLQLVQKLL